MAYTFREGSPEELNNFSFNSTKGHIFQTTYWEALKRMDKQINIRIR